MQNIVGSGFSEKYINLTKDFCCDNSNLKLIRWIGCKPGVYKGQKTIFSSEDLALCSWFQKIENYSYTTIDFESGDYAEIQLNNILFLFAKANWEADALESLKNLEIKTNQQGAVIGSIIPFNLESPEPPIYNTQIIKDIFEINTSSYLNDIMIINNCSPYKVSLSILYAY